MSRGFTMVEIIVVLGILGVVFGVGSIMAFNSIQRSVASNEANLVATLLMSQRGKAMANIHQTSFGLTVEATAYTTFEGSSFAAGTNKISTPKSAGITTSGDTEVVFSQLSGTTTPATLTLSDGSQSNSIDINSEGMINW